MHSLINSWVKNVYRWYINEFKTSASLSPADAPWTTNKQQDAVQLQLMHQIINFLPKLISTTKISFLYLLKQTYTHNPQHLLLRPKKIN
jgi:hypothetical protein